MQKFAITTISPPNYSPSQAFAEIADTLYYSLRSLGLEVIKTDDPGVKNYKHIILGSNLLPILGVTPQIGSILYNLEQVSKGSSWITPGLVNLFKNYETWDSSNQNIINFKNEFGIENVNYVPIGYVPELTRINHEPEKTIDVLFYGSLNPRREHIITELANTNTKIFNVYGVYGKCRDDLIARSRIVLNMHFYDSKIFEMVRVSYLLANKCCVLSESGTDSQYEEMFKNGIEFADYDDIVEKCKSLLISNERIDSIATKGHEIIKTMPMNSILKKVLGEKPYTQVPPQYEVKKLNTKTVCLNMIVKNESNIIKRCFDSAKRFIDYWVIVDTGSTDGTQDIIKNYMKENGIQGELHERPWVGFAHNRNEALELARGKTDYIMFMDADEIAVANENYELPDLVADRYFFSRRPRGGEFMFVRDTIIKSDLRVRYEGVIHEAIVCDKPYQVTVINDVVLEYTFDGSRNENPLEKYKHDAELLEKELEKDPENTRNTFYLGQSYRDAGMPDKALEMYTKREKMGGWPEEVWYAKFQIGVMKERLGRELDEIVNAYLAAYQFRPSRSEPLCELARCCRERNQHNLAYMFSNFARTIPITNDILFVDVGVYNWRSFDELGLALFNIQRFTESYDVFNKLIESGKIPASQFKRVINNRNSAAIMAANSHIK